MSNHVPLSPSKSPQPQALEKILSTPLSLMPCPVESQSAPQTGCECLGRLPEIRLVKLCSQLLVPRELMLWVVDPEPAGLFLSVPASSRWEPGTFLGFKNHSSHQAHACDLEGEVSMRATHTLRITHTHPFSENSQTILGDFSVDFVTPLMSQPHPLPLPPLPPSISPLAHRFV